MSKLNQQRAQYFTTEAHIGTNEFHFTSDDLAFDSIDNARSHAYNLKHFHGKNGDVDTVTRAEFEAWEQNEGKNSETEQPTGYAAMKRPELTAALTERKIAFKANGKNTEFIELLEADDAAKAATDNPDAK